MRDWLPWRNPPGLTHVERVKLNNAEGWRLLTKAPVGRAVQFSGLTATGSFMNATRIGNSSDYFLTFTAITALSVWALISALICLVVEAERFNHNLISADRRLHGQIWWNWHLAGRSLQYLFLLAIWSVMTFYCFDILAAVLR